MDDTIGIRDSFLSLDSFSLTFKNIFRPSYGAGGGGDRPHGSVTVCRRPIVHVQAIVRVFVRTPLPELPFRVVVT